MKTLLIAVLLCSPTLAFALPLTFQFDGLLPLGGTVAGTFSYDTDSAPIGVNVRGLAGNQVYALTGFDLTMTPSAELLPYLPAAVNFTPQSSSVEFCIGHCIFASESLESLTLNTGLYSLRLAFQDQWGPMIPGASQVRSTNGRFELMTMPSGTLTAVNVPELGSGWLLGLSSLGFLLIYNLRRLPSLK